MVLCFWDCLNRGIKVRIETIGVVSHVMIGDMPNSTQRAFRHKAARIKGNSDERSRSAFEARLSRLVGDGV